MLASMLYFDNFELTNASFLNVVRFICNIQQTSSINQLRQVSDKLTDSTTVGTTKSTWNFTSWVLSYIIFNSMHMHVNLTAIIFK